MIVEFDLPELPEPSSELSTYWFRYFFVTSPSQNRDINALASTYMRLVEAAIIEYRLASAALRQVWSDYSSIQLRAMHRSVSHFESCITDMHRAIATYRRLRNHPTRDPLAIHITQPKPAFNADKVANQLRNARDAVHHLDDKLKDGELTDGLSIALAPAGPEVPHPIEAGQTIKTLDRLTIGQHEILFSDLATWLSEMENIAINVARFDPRSSAASAQHGLG